MVSTGAEYTILDALDAHNTIFHLVRLAVACVIVKLVCGMCAPCVWYVAVCSGQLATRTIKQKHKKKKQTQSSPKLWIGLAWLGLAWLGWIQCSSRTNRFMGFLCFRPSVTIFQCRRWPRHFANAAHPTPKQQKENKRTHRMCYTDGANVYLALFFCQFQFHQKSI